MADGFGDHHSTPEHDPQALRAELDACKVFIEELRQENHELRDANGFLVDALVRIRNSHAEKRALRAEASAALRRAGVR